MKINGVELVVNLYDVNFAEHYEAALECLTSKELPAGSKLSEQIRYNCQKICDFFDTLFGKGTAEQIFQGKVDLNIALDYCEMVIEEADNQTKAMNARVAKYNAAGGNIKQ